MPCVYDDIPGSWATQSLGWPEVTVPKALVEHFAGDHETLYPGHGCVVRLCKRAKVPYGAYVNITASAERIADQLVRIETKDQARRMRALIRRLSQSKRGRKPKPDRLAAVTGMAWLIQTAKKKSRRHHGKKVAA